ncbi:MAG: flagellar protein flhE [Pantoea eucrina]|jgi:flagellar protein FlhE|uniref:flagellar protein FlhE n=1 Tax=Pantoea eucrina TaxID=472693 RepID=UPI00080F42E8|nr:flagellar protein FlhE [Pantoea eucrina]MDF2785622.1 flagellar protein flhE [Pantoea eucrina]
MRRCYQIVLPLLLLAPLAGIAATGAWSASVSGPGLGARGSWLLSPALQAPSAAPGNIAVVSWRYQLSRPAPSGLVVRLCASQRCVELDGASGSTRGLALIPAEEPLYLAFGFQGQGSLPPGLRVLSSEVTVNYR